jgi:hypothetical protein
MMADDHLAPEINRLRDAIEAQTAGLMQMLKIVAAQNAMLKEILAACTAEPEGPSPLVKLMLDLNGTIKSQSAAIARIEQAVTP